MKVSLTKTMSFDAAHWLPCFPEGHKCRRMHGHTFQLDIIIEGEVDPAVGYLQDFGEVKRIATPICEQLDHHCLNDIPGLEVPTVETLSKWIYDRLKPNLPLLAKIRVHETPTSFAEYAGEE